MLEAILVGLLIGFAFGDLIDKTIAVICAPFKFAFWLVKVYCNFVNKKMGLDKALGKFEV